MWLDEMRADLERITADADPNLMPARPDSPLCRGCKMNLSALERLVKENFLQHHSGLVALGSEEYFPPCLRILRFDNHAFSSIGVSGNVFLRRSYTYDSHTWPLKVSRSKAAGSEIHFVFVPLTAAHVFD